MHLQARTIFRPVRRGVLGGCSILHIHAPSTTKHPQIKFHRNFFSNLVHIGLNKGAYVVRARIGPFLVYCTNLVPVRKCWTPFHVTQFVIDSRFRSESIGLNEIKGEVQSVDPQVRRNINLTGLSRSMFIYIWGPWSSSDRDNTRTPSSWITRERTCAASHR